jgi:hypothetical protein
MCGYLIPSLAKNNLPFNLLDEENIVNLIRVALSRGDMF